MSRNSITEFYKRIGMDSGKRRLFYEKRISSVCGTHHIAIDGTLRQDNSSVNDFSSFSRKSRVKGVRDHRFQPKNDHRFQPVQMSSNSTNIQNAVDSIFVSLSYLRQYGSVAEVHLSDYLVLSSVRLACKVEAIGSVEKTVQYALRKN